VREAARSDPKNAAAWSRLAEIAEKKGEPRRAADYLRKVAELEPSEDTGLKLKMRHGDHPNR